MKYRGYGGGWPAIWYTLRKGREAGGLWKLWKAMRSRNACKTCAVGMGGQRGGMVNEAGHFPEVCKKSLQAMVSDMQGGISADFFRTYSVDQLKSFSSRELEHCGRLTQPLLLEPGASHYQCVSWDTALERIAARLRAIRPIESFWYFSGRSSNEAGFLLQLFARVYGTNHVNNCSYYCHQASGVGLTSAIGTSAGTVSLEDLEGADLVLVIGANPASNHPRLMRSLMAVRRRGGQVVGINPLVETGLVNFRVPSDWRSLFFGTRITSHYIQPDIGGDLALLTAIARQVVDNGAHDEGFLTQHCQDWVAYREYLRALDPDSLATASGVGRDEIAELARIYASGRNVVFCWTMGITHHVHGVENVQAIANLALLRGMVGRPRAGLLPIRGHSNVQGLGTVGVTPRLKEIVLERLTSQLGIQVPSEPGMDTMACLEAALEGRLRSGFCLGGNLFGSNPDSSFARRALAALEQVVYVNTTLNTGHAHGLGRETLILPALARDEEPAPTTQESMFSLIRYSDGGPRRHDGPRSEIELIAELARRTLGDTSPLDWTDLRDTRNLRQTMGRIIPGLEELAEIDSTRREFFVPGRRLDQPRFPTPDGRARLHCPIIPPVVPLEGGLRLMTIRSEGQFNTVVYEEYDLYRGQDRRDIILLNPADIQRLSLRENQRVTVRSEVGHMDGILVRSFAQLKAGNAAMYYPEANVLVPRHLDPRSRTPAFKNVRIQVTADDPSAAAHTPQLVALSIPTAATSRENMRAC